MCTSLHVSADRCKCPNRFDNNNEKQAHANLSDLFASVIKDMWNN